MHTVLYGLRVFPAGAGCTFLCPISACCHVPVLATLDRALLVVTQSLLEKYTDIAIMNRKAFVEEKGDHRSIQLAVGCNQFRLAEPAGPLFSRRHGDSLWPRSTNPSRASVVS